MAKTYTQGDILLNPITGWDIEVLDPEGDIVTYVHVDPSTTVDEGILLANGKERVSQLLSHLNR